MRVTLISPDRALFDGDASSVVAPAFDGLVGVLPRHAPFLTVLGEGVLTVTQTGSISRFALRGGFLQVAGDVVRVVAEQAEPSSSA